MSVFLPNGKNLIRKCLHSKYIRVFFTAVSMVIHISAPSSLTAVINICHCTRLQRFKKAVCCYIGVCCSEASVVCSQSAV